MDHSIKKIKLFNTSVTGVTAATKKLLQATTTQVVATGQLDFYVKAIGF
jgi:hypothetical protein